MKTKFSGILTLLLAFVVQFTFAQDRTISGTISDESGLPLPGVNIIVQGTNNGTQTDFDGNYSISASTGSVLSYSFVGYKTTEKTVGASSNISLSMDLDVAAIEEVVIVGYGTQAKSATTGSITVIDSQEFVDVPVANIAETLQGKSSGLQSLSASGQPGANSSVLIRGLGSVNGNIEPLYIVDGVPINANSTSDLGSGGLDSGNRDPLSNINAADIESVTILKDASSTSIYGARAANGVILITTKSGKKGKARIDFSTQTSVSARAVTKFQVLNTSEYLELQREADVNSGFTEAQAFARNPDSDIDTDWAEYAYNDWDAFTKKTNLSITGGNDTANYFVSLGHLDQEGIAVGSGLERLSSRLNLNANVSNNIKVGMGLSYSRTSQRTALAESAFFASPVVGTYLFTPTTAPYLEDGRPNPENSATGGTSFIQDLFYDSEGSVTDRLIGNVFGSIDFLEDFTFKTQFGRDYSNFNYSSYGSNLNTANPAGGAASRVNQNVFNWTLTNMLSYSKLFNENHKVNVTLGQELNKEGFDDFGIDVEDFPNGILQNIGSAATVTGHFSTTEESSLESYFMSANYGYQNKYHLNAAIRKDGSSRFGPNNKWGTFWSVGGNWVISKESFFDNVDFMNLLKLKSSYGVQGNLPSGRYSWQGIFLNDTYNESPAVFPSSTKQNLDFKWEEQNLFNVGLEFGFLNNRINGEITYFNRETTDLIFPRTLASSTGFTQTFSNEGDFKNSGFEGQLSYDVIRAENTRWTLGGNITILENEVTKVTKDTEGPDGIYIREVGEAWNTFYLERWAGVDPATGSPMWLDENNNITFTYSEASREKVGSANPDFYGGFFSNLSYKNWEFNAAFSYQVGNKIFNNTSRITNSDGAFSGFNQSREQLDRWQNPGDVSENPIRIVGNPSQSNQRSTRWLEDGDFLRLKNLSVAYNLPNSLTDKSFLNSARIYVQGTNILTISSFNGDPEQSINGQHWFVYPNAQTVSIGLDVSF
ncbi:SusC/RagA family TonB-linked outer membrane protein [Lacinutrix salivirga]